MEHIGAVIFALAAAYVWLRSWGPENQAPTLYQLRWAAVMAVSAYIAFRIGGMIV